MEVQAEDGKALLVLENASKTQLGRGTNIACNHPTVSRRQLVLQLQNSSGEGEKERSPRVYVEVTGPNPICILRSGSSLEILKKGEHASLGAGDRFSLSVKDPHFFTLTPHQLLQDEEKGIQEAVARRQRRSLERKHNLKSIGDDDITQLEELDVNSIELTKIDPVAEFGFLVEGSEFEQFGKRGVHDATQWDWSLSKESEKSSDDEDIVGEKKPKRKSTKKKEAKYGQGDRDWKGESDEENQQLNKLKVSKRPITYKTRSKSSTRDANSTVSERAVSKQNQVDASIDDGDETLGGFIVDDDAETADEGEEDEEDELTDDDFDEDENDDDMEDEVIDENTKRKRKPLCKFGNNCYRKNKEHLKEYRHE